LRNVILDDLRKQARKLTQAEDLDRFASALTTKEDPTAYPELLALIDGELSDLSDVTRKVFVMYAIEGFNHREISEQLAIAEGTSRWHFSEARRALRDLLTSNWMRHGL
jgi:RNA polymerase sigma-70 factor (ECF subfamily)